MKIKVQVPVNASPANIWKVITDIENSANTISAIEKIDVLETREEGLLGFKWRETRKMFGKEATEIMWITELVENEYYQTRAESHGSVYISRVFIEQQGNQTYLGMQFVGKAQTFGAKLMSFIFSPLIKGASKKALLKDLEEIKAVVEN